MKNTILRGARKAAAFGLALVMASCGGGGGGGNGGEDPPVVVPGEQFTGQMIHGWAVQQVGSGATGFYPGNTGSAVGGQPAYAVWIDKNPGEATSTVRQASAAPNIRGVTKTVAITGLPDPARSNATVVMKAGSWTLLLWTDSDASNEFGLSNLNVRLTGNGFDSGNYKLTSRFTGSAWDVRAPINESGQVRIFWDEPGRPGVNGRVVNGAWEFQPDTNVSLVQLQRHLVGADGQGRLFFARQIDGKPASVMRALTAAGGLGPEVRIDEPELGEPNYGRDVSEEGLQGFTTVGFHKVDADTGCFAMRRLVDGVLQAGQCITVTGDAMPNEEHVSLATNVQGHGVLVWSTGLRDTALYASRRNAAGVWSAPIKLANVTAPGENFTWLWGIKTAVSPTGQALVIYKAQSAGLSPATVRAFVAPASGNWPAATELSQGFMGNYEAALGFNAAGVPGVLQMVRTGDTDAVMMSTWRNGVWSTHMLRSGVHFPKVSGILRSILRLTPQGTAGWLAMWCEATESDGYQFWVGEYR